MVQLSDTGEWVPSQSLVPNNLGGGTPSKAGDADIYSIRSLVFDINDEILYLSFVNDVFLY